MAKYISLIGILCLTAFLPVRSSGLTAGWRNDGSRRYELPKAAKSLWSAPLDGGMDAFSVSWRGGAAGTVRIVGSRFGNGLEIAKTNDVGSVCIRPKRPFFLPQERPLRIFARRTRPCRHELSAGLEKPRHIRRHICGLVRGCFADGAV